MLIEWIGQLIYIKYNIPSFKGELMEYFIIL